MFCLFNLVNLEFPFVLLFVTGLNWNHHFFPKLFFTHISCLIRQNSEIEPSCLDLQAESVVKLEDFYHK